ncbi:hypothetical protein [Thalassospira sp.]|uniref:hypothetical protein n=1 Tax=Thalassospira sp. TaxID=1912094 RepID=UPI0027347A00|nr:hypothetical protein [Thalassospira sp.]MDP2699703.1 hypothetical protein [Thalassospira sp.]
MSLSFTLDQFILTDSLFASLFILVISTLALGALACRPLGLGEALALGVLLSLALLLREGAGILSVLFLLLLGCRIFLSPQGQRLKSCIGAVSVFVPLFLTSQIYQGWNENRTGDRFITTGGQTVYLQGLVDAARRDTLIFSGDTDMDLAARDILADYSFAEVLQILSRLYDEGYQAPALAAMSRGKYMQAWVERPSSMLRMTVGHMRESLAFMTFQPLAAIRDTGFWATGERPWPDYSGLKRNLSDGTGTIILFGFESLERVTGILLTLSFLLTPAVWLVRAFRRRDWNTLLSGPVLVPVALWLFYLGFMIAHAMVHLETRYMAPVLPFSIMIGLLGIQGIYIAVRQRIRGRNAS